MEITPPRTNIYGQRQTNGHLEAFACGGRTHDGRIKVWCYCHNCGGYINIRKGDFISENTKSCGCLTSAKDISNQYFGRLVAKHPTDERSGGYVKWKCKCTCGNTCLVRIGNLISGTTKSCGCLQKEKLSEFASKQIGKKHPNWKSDLTDKEREDRRNKRNTPEDIEWRELVYERDNHTCQKCEQVGGELNAHHIKNFAKHEELRYVLENGITFCEKCHREFHKIFGRKNNTREQV